LFVYSLGGTGACELISVVTSLAKINTHRVSMACDDYGSASAADRRFFFGGGGLPDWTLAKLAGCWKRLQRTS